MQESQETRMPTGIASLDPILDGGVPPGTLTLLFGDIGAGHYEFAYSSTVNSLAEMHRVPGAGILYPKKILYITFTRLEADIRREIVQSFPTGSVPGGMEGIAFEDLSDLYFDRSIVPDSWYSRSDTLTRLQKRSEHANIFMRLTEIFAAAEPETMIILDSITDIATQTNLPNLWADLTGFLRGLQRFAKTKRLAIYLLLSRGIIEQAKEIELADIADAVFLFRWEESTGSRRQRVMYFEKFRGVMPHLEEQDLVKFAVRISTTGGFEVSNIRMVI
ncbi:HTR-like protein [Methanoregula boonei 6A8]|uniref:HTR-like protein n=1 Tax=Methanoregula boonei (strain DSM 21154 / JCM 14090 / 6A8) TaxID=456442 RepID=A7IAV9_METB6|nr:ATPase domain-containing protein [Methanoregula boonei]ABS56870.1 HTR-like protein [Methanoregula boonei 6A8]